MSTRGGIGYYTNAERTKWRARYQHFGSYPTGLGATIFETVMKLRDYRTFDFEKVVPDNEYTHEKWQWLIRTFCAIYVDGHPHGWSQFPEICYCHNEGHVNIREIDENGIFEQHWITDENPDPLFIEWLYLFDRENATMDVYCHSGYSVKGQPSPEIEKINREGFYDYGHCRYRHLYVLTIDFKEHREAGTEPDWELISERANKMREMDDKRGDPLAEPFYIDMEDKRQVKAYQLFKDGCVTMYDPAEGEEVSYDRDRSPVQEFTNFWLVKGSRDNYVVEKRADGGYECTCKDYEFGRGRACKHCWAVEIWVAYVDQRTIGMKSTKMEDVMDFIKKDAS